MFWVCLGLSWAILALSWACLGPSWHPLGPSWHPLGPLGQDPENDVKKKLKNRPDSIDVGDHFGVISGSFSGPFLGLFLRIFWNTFGPTLGPFWLHFRSQIGPGRAKTAPKEVSRELQSRENVSFKKTKKHVVVLGFWGPEASQERLRKPQKAPKRDLKSSKTSKNMKKTHDRFLNSFSTNV